MPDDRSPDEGDPFRVSWPFTVASCRLFLGGGGGFHNSFATPQATTQSSPIAMVSHDGDGLIAKAINPPIENIAIYGLKGIQIFYAASVLWSLKGLLKNFSIGMPNEI